MMVIAVGLSSYNVALFHLVNHAFFVERMKNMAICWKFLKP
jgi:NADH-ubiquinone oxidoreductase chain 5